MRILFVNVFYCLLIIFFFFYNLSQALNFWINSFYLKLFCFAFLFLLFFIVFIFLKWSEVFSFLKVKKKNSCSSRKLLDRPGNFSDSNNQPKIGSIEKRPWALLLWLCTRPFSLHLSFPRRKHKMVAITNTKNQMKIIFIQIFPLVTSQKEILI